MMCDFNKNVTLNKINQKYMLYYLLMKIRDSFIEFRRSYPPVNFIGNSTSYTYTPIFSISIINK